MRTRTLDISLPDEMWARVDRFARSADYATVSDLVAELLDHVQQGVYRSGAWEREWLIQCFGEEAVQRAYESAEDPLNQKRESP